LAVFLTPIPVVLDGLPQLVGIECFLYQHGPRDREPEQSPGRQCDQRCREQDLGTSSDVLAAARDTGEAADHASAREQRQRALFKRSPSLTLSVQLVFDQRRGWFPVMAISVSARAS